MAILSYDNAVSDSLLTVEVGTAENLEEAQLMQVPLPFAKITPDGGVIELRASFSSQPVSVFGVLAHGLPSGAEIEFLDQNGATLSTAQPVRPNALSVAQEQAVSQVRFRMTNVGQLPIRIGLLWAGRAFEAVAEEAGEHGGSDYGYRSRVGATIWTNPRTVARTLPVTLRGLTDDQAWGTLEDIFTSVGTTRPVIYMPRTDSQLQIDRRSVYGTLGGRGRIIPEKPFYRAEFDVEEMR